MKMIDNLLNKEITMEVTYLVTNYGTKWKLFCTYDNELVCPTVADEAMQKWGHQGEFNVVRMLQTRQLFKKYPNAMVVGEEVRRIKMKVSKLTGNREAVMYRFLDEPQET